MTIDKPFGTPTPPPQLATIQLQPRLAVDEGVQLTAEPPEDAFDRSGEPVTAGVEVSPALANLKTVQVRNPKTSEVVTASVHLSKGDLKDHPDAVTIRLKAPDGALMGFVRYKEIAARAPEETRVGQLYGYPNPQPTSHLWIDMTRVMAKYRGTGVYEAMTDMVLAESQNRGHNSRVKSMAVNMFGSVSALARYKRGFRPQPANHAQKQRYEQICDFLEEAASSGRRVTPEEAEVVDGIMMFWPEDNNAQ